MAILSFIIPLYNTEAFIRQCLSSIVEIEADKSEYEVIVIDDGSTDGSAAIVQSFRQNFDNIILIHQENQGVSVARMNGVRQAKGDYIWFIDSDDYLLPGAVKTILDTIHKQKDIDCIASPLIFSYEASSEELIRPDTFVKEEIIRGKDFLKRKPVSVCPPQFIFKKALFNNKWLFFPEKIRHEDEYFCRVLQYFSNYTYVLKQPSYVYRQWAGSFMNQFSANSMEDMVQAYKQLSLFVETAVSSEDRSWMRADIISFLLGTHSWHSHMFNSKEFRSFRKNHLPFIWGEFKKNAHLFPIKERIIGTLLLKAPKVHSTIISAKHAFKRIQGQ